MTATAGGGPLLVDGVTLVGPVDWVQLPAEPVPDADVPAVLGPLLAGRRSGTDLHGELEVLSTLHRSLVTDSPQAVAVWVPEPPAPVVAAALVVELLVPDPEAPVGWADLVEQVAGEAPAPGTHRQWRAVHVLEDVPWGDAVMAHEMVAVGQGPLEERLTYLVRPHGSDDLLRLSFGSPYPSLSEEFREGAVALLLHLEVDLVAAP